MNNKFQYYLNRETTSNCQNTSNKYANYLDKDNYLGEFITSEEQEQARQNLGISDIIKKLNKKIDNKVIANGSIAWDYAPNQGSTNKVLSSDVIYNTLLNYVTRYELDNTIQELWTNLIKRIQQLETNLNGLQTEIDNIWERIEGQKDETYSSIIFEVSPDYITDTQNVSINVSTKNQDKIFSSIKLYVNDTLLTEVQDVNKLNYNTTITDTSTITCEVIISGIEYSFNKVINKYNPMWMGAGTNYNNIINNSNIINSLNEDYEITFNQNDKLFIVIENSLAGNLNKATMGGLEIPFTQQDIVIGSKSYKVFTSQNNYNRGTYKIVLE